MKSVKTLIEILAGINTIRLGRPIPLYCEWEVTSLCNMRCDFCSTRREVVSGDLSTEGAYSIIDELQSLKTKIIHFSGGEPTLRKDLPDLLRRADKAKMMTSLTTNGSSDISMTKELLVADLISVSLDGPEQFHDQSRNFPGAFKRALNNIEFLRKSGKKPLITAVYMEKTSFSLLEELVKIAKSFKLQLLLTVCARNLNDFNNQSSDDYARTISLFKDYKRDIVNLKKKYPKTVANPNPYLSVLSAGGLDSFGCRAMDIALSIKADGSISFPCNGLSLHLFQGNIRQAYYGPMSEKFRQIQGKHQSCRACAIRCMASASALLRFRGILSVFDSYIRSL